jgi:hypothetical protein
MPARTRARVPAERVYSSTPALEQVKIRPKKTITYRRSTGNTRRARQETLTQMDFVKLHESFDEDVSNEDISYDLEAEKRKRKRRRTDGDVESSAKHYTQTLTQLDFLSTPATRPEQVDTEGDLKVEDDPDEAINRNDARVSTQVVMGPPKTPSRRRVLEIPSSQSPITPLSVHSFKDSPIRSPMGEIGLNIDAQPRFQANQSSLQLPKLEIRDTFDYSEESQLAMIPSTPLKYSSATKSVRFASDVHVGEASPSKSIIREIEDSEAESEEPESCYDDLGPETQMEANNLVSSSDADTAGTVSEYQYKLETKETQNGNSIRKTPRHKRGVERASDEDSTEDVPPVIQYATQHMASQYTQIQRLSPEEVNSMAPRSLHSDIFVSIHPDPVEAILNRTKDHDFRSFRIPDSVSRMWFYETKPASRVKYVAAISGAKKPGDIESTDGAGNIDFNTTGRKGRFAYQIMQVYELADPLSLETLKANGWLEAAPTRYNFVRPAVLGALMANLKYSLLNYKEPAELATSLLSDSQDAEAQLHSTIQQFTSPPSSAAEQLHLNNSPEQTYDQVTTQHSSRGTSRQNVTLLPSQARSSHPSQATTVDMTPQTDDTEREQSVVLDSPLLNPFSSQLLTRSQMLPDSLLNDSIPPPPEFIGDSEDEDDEL